MSIDAYKIAIQIALTENVTRGLRALSGQFTKVNADAEGLHKRMERISSLRMRGLEMLGMGHAGFKLLEGSLDKAMEYERHVAQMRQMGLGDAQIADAKKFVRATDIINTSVLDRMRIFTEAQGSFRESGMDGAHALAAAKEMMPILATYEVASSTLSGDKRHAADMQMRSLNKIVEIGGGIGNTERAKDIVDGVFKSVQSSGKMVDEGQLKDFFTHGSSATNQQNLRTIFAGLEPVIGEFSGSTVGTGLNTAYIRMNGMLAKLPKLAMHEMQRLGLADATGKKQTVDLMHLQATDLPAYVKEIEARYAKAGITSRVDMERENAILFGRKGAQIINKIMSQMPVIEASLAAYDQSKGASETAGNPQNKALLARQNFEKKWENLQLVLAQDGGLIDLATRGFTLLGDAIEKTTKAVHAHPELAKMAVGMVTLFSGLMFARGLLMLARMAVLSVVNSIVSFRNAMLWLNTARRFNPDVGPWFKRLAALVGRGFSIVKRAVIGPLGKLVAQAGRAALGFLLGMGPVGWAVTAVVAAVSVAAFLLYKHWGTIKPKLLEIWSSIKTKALELWESLKTGFYQFVHFGLNSFQSFFNALIDGINVLLPKAKEIKRATFADDYAKAHLPPPRQGGSPYVALPSQGQSGQPIVLKLDGRVLAQVVTKHQSREASRPGMGAPTHDPIMGAPPVGLGYSGSW